VQHESEAASPEGNEQDDVPAASAAPSRIARIRHWATWRLGGRLLPLPLVLYTNRHYLAGKAPAPPDMPDVEWSFSEQQRLLERSDARLQNLEAKGPGLATVCAVVAAANAVAISLTWEEAEWFARVLLATSAVYALMSLAAPIALVGPIDRSTITSEQLGELTQTPAPQSAVARQYAQAAADNDRSTLRLSNLQAASRSDLTLATLLFAMWMLVALLGI
jgi:hypothetical protein